jgi:hypothetical protein
LAFAHFCFYSKKNTDNFVLKIRVLYCQTVIYVQKSTNFDLMIRKNVLSLHSQNGNGTIAQLVEQRTENPCVPGSIPGGTTKQKLIVE